MDIGMLWFDDSARPLPEKVKRAVDYYVQKYGRTPTLCLVNPSGLEGAPRLVAGVELRAARTVMPNHLWIGVDEKPEVKRPARRTASSASLIAKRALKRQVPQSLAAVEERARAA
ncbi:MAG: hypothetical protein AB1449_08175 [Chloroflexota bacterium]